MYLSIVCVYIIVICMLIIVTLYIYIYMHHAYAYIYIYVYTYIVYMYTACAGKTFTRSSTASPRDGATWISGEQIYSAKPGNPLHVGK